MISEIQSEYAEYLGTIKSHTCIYSWFLSVSSADLGSY